MIAPALSLLHIVVFALAGLLVLLVLRPTGRAVLLPFAPLLGVAAAVVVLHWQTWVMPISAAPWVVIGVAAIVGVVGIVRWRDASIPRARASDALPAVVGAIPVLLVLIPSMRLATSRPVLTTGSYDAAYYVSVSRWLLDNTGLALPEIGTGPSSGTDAPTFGAAHSTVDLPLRYGQELVQTWLSALTGIDLIDGFGPWMAASMMYLMLGAVLLLRALGVTRGWSVAGALAVSASLSALAQFGAQNADSLLGIALALGSTGALISALDRTDGRRAIPLWVPALMLAACIGVYTELALFLGPVLVVVVLLRNATWRERLGTAAVALGLSLAICLPAWIRGALGLFTFGRSPDYVVAPIEPAHAALMLFGPLRHLAVDPRLATVPGLGIALLLLVALVGLIGFIAAVAARATRATAVGAVLALIVLAYLAYRGDEYVYSRGIDMMTPLIICVVIAGLWALPGLVPRWSTSRWRAVTAVVVGGWLALNVTGFVVALSPDDSERTVSSEFDEAAEWAERVGGASLAVAVPEFFDQLWLADALREYPDVSYPYLRGDLGYLGLDLAETFVDPGAEVARYVIVGRGIHTTATVVAENSRFRMLDTSAGPFALAVPAAPNASWRVSLSTVDGMRELIADAPAHVQVTVDPTTEAFTLHLNDSDNAPLGVTHRLSVGPGWTAQWVADGSVLVERSPAASTTTTLYIEAEGFFVSGVTSP